jgi:hypothetical protein
MQDRCANPLRPTGTEGDHPDGDEIAKPEPKPA